MSCNQKKYHRGFTASSFDLLHAGHIMMLREAKSICDYLIVGLQIDPSIDREGKNKPVQPFMERFIQISAVKYVDEVIPYKTEQDLRDLLIHLPIDVRILGEDHYGKKFTGWDLEEKGLHAIYFNRRKHNWSTTNLRTGVYNNYINNGKYENEFSTMV